MCLKTWKLNKKSTWYIVTRRRLQVFENQKKTLDMDLGPSIKSNQQHAKHLFLTLNMYVSRSMVEGRDEPVWALQTNIWFFFIYFVCGMSTLSSASSLVYTIYVAVGWPIQRRPTNSHSQICTACDTIEDGASLPQSSCLLHTVWSSLWWLGGLPPPGCDLGVLLLQNMDRQPTVIARISLNRVSKPDELILNVLDQSQILVEGQFICWKLLI